MLGSAGDPAGANSGICISDWGGSLLGKLRVVGDESIAFILGFATFESFL